VECSRYTFEAVGLWLAGSLDLHPELVLVQFLLGVLSLARLELFQDFERRWASES